MTAGPQQFIMRSLLDDVTTVEHDQAAHAGDRRQPVRNRDHRLAGHQCIEARLNGGFDLTVECRGRLIQDQDRRILENDAGDGDALALAAGQLDAALSDLSFITMTAAPILEVGDELVGMGKPRCRDDLRVARFGTAVADVVADRTMQQRGVLGDDGDLRAQALLGRDRNVVAVN